MSADIANLLRVLDGFLSDKLAAARRKHDKNMKKREGEPLPGIDLGLLAADRLDYLREQVRAALKTTEQP